jgi:hypothetical protein
MKSHYQEETINGDMKLNYQEERITEIGKKISKKKR